MMVGLFDSLEFMTILPQYLIRFPRYMLIILR